jgi:threonine-phosphate decarboxylase
MRKIPCPFSDPTPLFRHGDRPAALIEGAIDFSTSINPLGPPRSACRALRLGLAAVGRYPDPECSRLAALLASRHGVAPAQVMIGNGSNELIYTVARAFRPRRAAIVEPTYTEYLRASLLAGAVVDHWLAEREDFQAQPFDPQEADLVWVCNPNNPTGHLWPRGRLEEWVAAFPRVRFVVDEAFLPFLQDEADQSLVGACARLPNLVVLRSLTKLYALPGLRLGYAVAHAELAERLRGQTVPWSVNALAQVAGLAALEDADFVARTRAWLGPERDALHGRLRGFAGHLQPLPSRANFLLVRLRGITADWLARRLQDHGIAIREAGNFVGLDASQIRVAVRTAADNDRLRTALGLVLHKR